MAAVVRGTLGRNFAGEQYDQHRRGGPVPVHVRVRHRRPSGQDVRPGVGRDPRRDRQGRPERPRRVRDGDDDRPGRGPRRDLDDDLRRLPGGRPRDGSRHRLHEGRVRLRLHDLRHDRVRPRAVARYRPGCRRRARGPPGRGRHGARCRRPGDDVRVRLPRDAGADAAANRPRPSDGAAPGRGPQVRSAAVSPPGRQDAGHDRVRARRREAGQDRRRLRSARPGRPRRAAPPGHRRDRHPADDPGRPPRLRPDHARQPDRPIRRPAARWATPG